MLPINCNQNYESYSKIYRFLIKLSHLWLSGQLSKLLTISRYEPSSQTTTKMYDPLPDLPDEPLTY